MAIALKDFLAALPAEEQIAIAQSSRDAVAEELSLRELRKARRLSQKELAAKLRTNQAGVSKIERRADLMLSTLRGYVEAAGGSLELIARFPEAPAVRIAQMRDLGAPAEKAGHQDAKTPR